MHNEPSIAKLAARSERNVNATTLDYGQAAVVKTITIV